MKYKNRRKKPIPYEYYEQVKVANYIRLRYPNILWTASSAGMWSNMHVGKKYKAMGVKRGCPDIMIFEPRNNWFGLFIEMKTAKTFCTEKGTLSIYQESWINELNKRNYSAAVCYGSDEAIKIIEAYFKL